MLSKILFQSPKQYLHTNKFARLFCTSQGSIVKIGDKCFVPVPCPKDGASDATTTDKYIRITRPEPGKVRFSFVPEEWFQFFHNKTGISGPYVFLVSVSTFLVSKEIYVMEHEYYSGLSILIMMYLVLTRFGKDIGKTMDKAVDKYEGLWISTRDQAKKLSEDGIAQENKLQQSMEGQLMLQDAKKENVALQLEAAYRERILTVYKGVKRRLDFQVLKVLIDKKFLHRNVIEWVVSKVIASYTPEKEKETIEACIQHLSTLSEQYKKG